MCVEVEVEHEVGVVDGVVVVDVPVFMLLVVVMLKFVDCSLILLTTKTQLQRMAMKTHHFTVLLNLVKLKFVS